MVESARWNRLVLVVASGICLFFGVVGIIAGALRVTQEPMVFMMMSVAFLIGALFLRRRYRRYEAEVLPLAAEERETASEAGTPNTNAYP